MRFGLKKSILSVLLGAVFLFTCFAPVATFAKSYGSFTVEFLDNTKGSDLSNIKLDIYESTLDGYASDANANIYAHNYAYSVYTTKNGTITFSKPSVQFLVLVDLSTLPNDVGIDNTTVFYYDTLKKNGSFAVSNIADFEISCDSSMEHGVRVDIFNASCEPIMANYAITPTIASNAKTSVLASTYQISGSVTVGNNTKSYNFTIENSGDKVELVANALKSNRISKEDALDLYLELYDSGECSTILACKLLELFEDKDFFNQLPTSKQEGLEMVITPSITRTSYVYRGPSGTGAFAIHYDYTSASVPQIIIDIYNAFVSTHNFFVTGLYFQKPESSVGSNIYDVYIVIGSGNSFTQPNSYYDGTSYIQIYLSSFSVSFSDVLKGTVTHEYMHAISNTYRYGLANVDAWFVDAIASWAPYRQFGSLETGNTGHINNFLDWNYTSLVNQDVYGAALFPLFLQKFRGGDSTIKNILVYLQTYSSYTIYQAINSATSGDFQGAFAEFWMRNYDPISTYSGYTTNSWYTEPGDGTVFGPPSLSYGVLSLASRFIQFGVTPNSNTYITINAFSGTTSEIRNYALFKGSNGAIVAYDISPYTGSLISFSIPSGCIGGIISSINVGLGGTMIGCQLTVS